MKHTKGPWHVGGSVVAREGEIGVRSAVVVAMVQRNTPGHPRGTHDWDPEAPQTSEECDANARLIAAAPDLHAAATLAVATIERLDKNGSAVGTLDVLRAAIAKAEGGSL